MIVSDFVDVNNASGYFILDIHDKGNPGQSGNIHDDELFLSYKYNIHSSNKLREGVMFLYRRPSTPFSIFGGGIVESISVPDQQGYRVASITHGFKLVKPIIQGDPFIEDFRWERKTKPGRGWQGFWYNYGMLRIEKSDYIGLVGNSKCIPVLSSFFLDSDSTADEQLIREIDSSDQAAKGSVKRVENDGPIGPPPRDSRNNNVYKRDKNVANNALNNARHKCEIDGNHVSFFRRGKNVLYCEPHHLVPMKYQVGFNNSLDREENIVALCSNCHNKIHYGEGAKEMISILYRMRKTALERVGIFIDLETLYMMYDL